MKLDADTQQKEMEQTAAELKAILEKQPASFFFIWKDVFNERELRLISNCQNYAMDDPAGLPGHNLMMIIDKFCKELDRYRRDEIDEY